MTPSVVSDESGKGPSACQSQFWKKETKPPKMEKQCGGLFRIVPGRYQDSTLTSNVVWHPLDHPR
ncbi:hypothetical protein T06_12128 [Trichinella sp. T6]|nr:hypothetical protein T06_12128 [Trichinella sp. T6]